MLTYRLSAFSDEYSASFDEQIIGLVTNKVKMTELRGIDGTNISDITRTQAGEIRRKLDNYGIGVSAIGSPLGKISINDPMEPHLDKLKACCETAEIVGTERIRMFSYYIPDGKYDEYRNEVIDRIGQMLDVAESYNILLCHENEKGIYGDNDVRCEELMKTFDGRLGCVFDPANFIQCGTVPFEDAYNRLKKYITYMHVKDAAKNGTIVPAGQGVGSFPELLAVLNREKNGEMILTIEPHLRVFKGLEALEGGPRTALGNAYETAADAFAAAVTNLRYCIPRTAKVQ